MAVVKQSVENSRKASGGLLFGIVILFLLVALVAVSVMGYMAYQEYNEMKKIVETDKIYHNVFINDIDVGNLTKEEALSKITGHFSADLEDKPINIVYEDKSLSYKFQDFGAQYNFSDSVEQAYNYARDGNLSERYELIMQLETMPHKITATPEYSYNADSIKSKVEPLADMVYIEPVNSSISRKNGKFIVTPEQSGRMLNLESTASEVDKLLANMQEGTIEAIVDDIAPQYVVADFDKVQNLIGTYYTALSGSGGRVTNIETALSKINDVTVYPGEIFSTNKAFGAMTYENGYRPAPVIVGGKLEDDFGGGVCQVSSTLYNALLNAELDIVERQNHSLKVGYVDWGFDATLAGDYIDLKFKNDTEYPVFLEGIAGKGRITVNIYGYEMHDPSRRLEFTNELVSTNKPGAEKILEDPSQPVGYRAVTSAAKTGYKYNVHKIVYENGQMLEKVLVNTSVYRAVNAEVTVGTGIDLSVTQFDTESIFQNTDIDSTLPGVTPNTELQQPQPQEQIPETVPDPAPIQPSDNEPDPLPVQQTDNALDQPSNNEPDPAPIQPTDEAPISEPVMSEPIIPDA